MEVIMKGRNMSRWRDPTTDPRAEQKTNLITPEGHAKLQSTRNFLWQVRHPELAIKVREAAAQGDRSENADYTYNKRELNRTLSRIRFLDQRLDVLKVVDRQPADTNRVFFGAWVTLENEEGKEEKIRIVGPDESDASFNLISIDAPRARLLLGKSLDDEVGLPTSEGSKPFIITAISYKV